ncbi:MAG: hypothetical protein ACD_28C00011G0007 [uncultured bacterium]|nr:MAG: hypothetical protein ACD_28C00011G0007 [uncultured bacterium]KKT77207.1 MAG: Ribosomal RNA large subunit methyltransferase H [Candidatus Peregrinibacteria bacterium GW2011_GWA2_44_7]
MKLLFLQVGKTKEASYRAIEDEFLKRLGAFCSVEELTVEVSTPERENKELQMKLEKWAQKGQGEYRVLMLDRGGRSMRSEAFADWIRVARDYEGGKVMVVIGGPHGFTEETLAYADERLSLSEMTFTHQMVRLFILEQLYRGFMILAGKSYHH